MRARSLELIDVLSFMLGCTLLGALTPSTCCEPNQVWSEQSFTYQFDYDSGVPQGQRDDFEARTEVAANRWNEMYGWRHSDVTAAFSASGSVTVHVSASHTALQWNTSMTSFGALTTIEVPLDWVNGTRSVSEVVADMQHEFGHKLGYEQATCCESIMSDPCAGLQDFTGCDIGMFNESVGHPDYDWDTFGEDIDCDDSDDDIYPGAYDTHPFCGYTGEWPCNTDYNCNADADCTEIGSICSNSPIVIDVSGNGFQLTNSANGVMFDLNGDGKPENLPWTDPTGDDAWLAMDLDGNGAIDNGRELFGNWTDQLWPTEGEVRNGFRGLALHDAEANGGNGNGWIDAGDVVYESLRLWHDDNQNGRSEVDELRGLRASGLLRIALNYREFLRQDEWGNWFRFGGRVLDGRNRDIGPMAFDVFLGYPVDVTPPGPTRTRQRQSRGR